MYASCMLPRVNGVLVNPFHTACIAEVTPSQSCQVAFKKSAK